MRVTLPLWFLAFLVCWPPSLWAQSGDTPRCGAEDLYYVGVGAGLDDETGLRTEFQLRNWGTDELTTRLLLFKSDGQDWPSALNFEWQGNSEGTVTETAGQSEMVLPSRSTLVVTLESRETARLGWACLESTPNLDVRTELQVGHFPTTEPVDRFEDGLIRVAEVEPTRAGRHVSIPIHYYAGQSRINTAFSLANLSAGAGEVRLTLTPGSESESIEKSLILSPGQLTAHYFDQFWGLVFPAVVGQEYWASAEIESEFPIAVSVQSTLQAVPVSGVKVAEIPTSSTGQSAELDQAIELAIGQEADFGDALSVEFWNVAADSRCPVDGLILCVWEGEAIIELKVQGRTGLTRVIQLSTYGDRNTTRFEGYRIELLQVEPDQVSTHPIAVGDYRIRFRVSSESIAQ